MRRSKSYSDADDDFSKPGANKRSLGKLYRVAKKNNPKAPAMTGRIFIQRHTLQKLNKDLRESEAVEVEGQIAGWPNRDSRGEYLTVELSPKFGRYQPNDISDDLGFIFDRDDNEE